MILAESIKKPIAPEVKINTDFSRLYAAKKLLLIVPPTPKTAAKNPDKLHPITAFFVEAFNFQFGSTNKNAT